MPPKTQKDEKQSSTASSTNPELDALEQEAMGGGPGAQEGTPSAPAVTLDPAMLATFWKTLFGVVARNAGEHWNLSEAEARQLGTLTVPVAERWLPSIMNKYGAEMVLATSLIFMVVPRLNTKKVKDEKKDGGDNGNTR